jgi:FkbM family methyltransferase
MAAAAADVLPIVSIVYAALAQALGASGHISVRDALAAAEPRAQHKALCALRRSSAQFGEDLLLLPALLNASRGGPGTFVEIGALDGVMFSNTIMLERCFGWHGLLVEGNPANHAKLLRSGRSSENTMMHSAVCSGRDHVNFTVSGAGVAGMPDAFNEFHRKQWRTVNKPHETVEVPCRPLDDLMDAAGLPSATFFSLDVEGAEAIVLQNVRPQRFGVVTIEADGHNEAKDAAAIGTLEGAGLRRVDKAFFLPWAATFVNPVLAGVGPVPALRVRRDSSRNGPFGAGGSRFKAALHRIVHAGELAALGAKEPGGTALARGRRGWHEGVAARS